MQVLMQLSEINLTAKNYKLRQHTHFDSTASEVVL